MLTTPESIRTLQRKLYRKAKQEPACRFHALYDKVYRADILSHAYNLVRANKGSAGIDGVTFEAIEEKEGAIAFVAELAGALKDKTYRPDPVKRVMIPKADGSQRPLGIPTIRDRVAQMAVKLVIEPIFEADFCDTSYGFRPRKSAHDAVDDVTHTMNKGYTKVIDADLSKYFDTIPHANLMATVAERISDGAVLHLIQMWLKAPVMEEDKDGTKRNIGACSLLYPFFSLAVEESDEGRQSGAHVPSAGETPGQDLHRQDRAGLRLPWLSLQPEGPDCGQGDPEALRFTCNPAL